MSRTVKQWSLHFEYALHARPCSKPFTSVNYQQTLRREFHHFPHFIGKKLRYTEGKYLVQSHVHSNDVTRLGSEPTLPRFGA